LQHTITREDFFSEEKNVSPRENIELEQKFTENEIREAVYGSYAEGAPGTDGLPFFVFPNHLENHKRGLVRTF
jgi:hypothetical protein